MLVRMDAVGGGTSGLEFASGSVVGDTTNIMSLDGNADYYIVSAFSYGWQYWGGCDITSVTNGTFESTPIGQFSYGDSMTKEWVVKVTSKGSPVTVTFQSNTASKWSTAINMV